MKRNDPFRKEELMTILVSGATGAVGRHIVAGLLEEGQQVRALTRHPETASLPAGVDTVAGDLSGPVDTTWFENVSQVFLFPAEGDLAPFVQAARDRGVEHFVVLSSLAAAEEFPRDVGSVSNLHHRRIELAVETSSIPATILRPGSLANNLLGWAYSIKMTGGVDDPYPTSRQAPIHEADVADAAVAAFLRPEFRGAVVPMTGPEALTRVEQLSTIGAAIGRTLSYREITADEFRNAMAAYIPDDVITMMLDYWRDTVAQPDVPRPVDRITGRPARTLAQWAADHAQAFS
jgi:uncharacterized protein YbjT (DUF2867 family)